MSAKKNTILGDKLKASAPPPEENARKNLSLYDRRFP